MRAILLALFLAAPAFADPIQGLDDPAFRLPFERVLRGDDPTALKDLHTAAEAGNTAAVLALPVVSGWLRTTLPFAERKKLGRVNGSPVAEAFANADPVAALWALGDAGVDMDALLQRAFSLYAAGEADKATVLFLTWVTQTGGYGPLPEGFFDRPVPPWAHAFVLRAQLVDNGVTLPADGDALLVTRLRVNDPAAWIALAAYADSPPETDIKAHYDRLHAIITAAEISQNEAEAQMAAALPAFRAISRSTLALDAKTAEAAAAIFRDEPEFQSLRTLCYSICPQTRDQCATAFVAGFGHPVGRASLAQPLTSLISTEEFFATPRGRLVLLRALAGQLGDAPAASPRMTAARQIDACFADNLLAAVL